ncbi:MAG: hypothetical protein HUU54_06130 [Ignavibacteriaceae bacterium]|nr:hypothetical protein [Ignavibacteriaceae bacterium]
MIITRPINAETIFGPGIEKSGSIIRGFTVGTNRDFSLQSGLRLQLSGKLSEDIELVASLTDENSPIQPEGNTESLEEIDKVFIQVKHKNATGIFGDYELKKSIGEFGNINRKLQGLYLDGNYDASEASISLASSKGKYNSINLAGIDGVQGPYTLTGANGERDIIVIAGSEKIFIDGETMTRGENNDYVIDYSLAQVTFTPKRIITNQSRIYIDFEYSDRKFSRNVFSGGASTKFLKDKIKISFQYLREGDDENAPIDFVFSDSDKEILRKAGDNRVSASKSGIVLAAADSLGRQRGIYEKRDTTINGSNLEYFKYNPGSDSAKYNITFSYIGLGMGDYKKESVGVFYYSGPRTGDYSPIIFLPLPELKQFSNLLFSFTEHGLFSISAELALSSHDKNRLSDVSDSDNDGFARSISLKSDKISLNIFDNLKTELTIGYKNRFIQNRFISPERFSAVEFNRDYNISNSSAGESETLNELSTSLLINEMFGASVNYGKLKKGENFNSDKYRIDLQFEDKESIKTNNKFDLVKTFSYGAESNWIRNYLTLTSEYSIAAPMLKVNYEDKKENLGSSDSLLNNSLNFIEVAPGIDFFRNSVIGFTTGYIFREDKLPLSGKLQRESFSRGIELKFVTRNIREISADLNFTIRKKDYSDMFRLLGFSDIENILIRNYLRYNLFARSLTGDIYYEASTQKTSRFERVFVEVTPGNGNYRYVGDLNNNGIRDESEFEPANYDGNFVLLTVPGDELIPNIDLKTGLRNKYLLKEFLKGSDLLSGIFSPVSGEITLRIEENSSERNGNKIYLLDRGSLLNDSTTIRGSQFIQKDVFINEDDPELSVRVRFNQRRSLSQFSSGPERGYLRERSLRIRFRLIAEIAMQADFINSTDHLNSVKNLIRNRRIEGNNIMLDLSYRPIRSVEVGLLLKTGRNEDIFPDKPTVMDNNAQTFRMIISLGGIGRIRAELERNEILLNKTDDNIPFELTGGNSPGKNYFARFNMDYRIAQNLQSTAAYDARKLGGSRIIHNFRGEVRAFF